MIHFLAVTISASIIIFNTLFYDCNIKSNIFTLIKQTINKHGHKNIFQSFNILMFYLYTINLAINVKEDEEKNIARAHTHI